MSKLFRPAENTSAFLKMGVLGFAGSGKTYTLSVVLRDLVLYMKQRNIDYAGKPVFMLDTETGSDWVKPLFEAAGIPFYTAKTRAFSDLLAAVDEAEKDASALLIDSVTHFWKELCDSYLKQKSDRLSKKANRPVRARLEFQDWGYLKGDDGWGQFTDRFINSNLHIGLAGRAGFEYDYFENDDGRKELEKTGIKMKAEGEMGYEPSLLVLMERHQKIERGSVEETWREASVLKDRSTLLDGKTFINPKFKDFLPHIERLNLGAKQLGVDTTRSTHHSIQFDGRDNNSVRRKIVLDEIQTLLLEFYPSTGKEDKQAKVAAIRKHCGDEEMTWTKMEELLPLIDLRLAYDSMYRELKGKPSQYAAILAPSVEDTTTEIDDEIPAEGGGTAPEQISLRDRLLKDISQLNTARDIAHWAAGVSAKYGQELSIEDTGAISKAIFARQAEINRNPGNNGGGAPENPAEPEKPPQEGGAEQAPPQQPDQPEDRPQTARKGRSKDAKPQAERTMADLMTA